VAHNHDDAADDDAGQVQTRPDQTGPDQSPESTLTKKTNF